MFRLERIEQRDTLPAIELFEYVGEIHRVDLTQSGFRHGEFDVAGETAELLRKMLHVQP